MKIKNPVFLLATGLVFSLLFSNCASLTGFQTGRTVGQGNSELLISANVSQTPEFDVDFDDTTDIQRFFFPNFETSLRYGVTEKFDFGLRLNTNLNFAQDVRYQFIGDQESPVAVAAGFGIGIFGYVIVPLLNVQFPLYFSIHPTESVSIYVIPRYTAQFVTDIGGMINYFGGNAGVLFGKKVQIGFDAGIYNLSAGGSDLLTIVTFGFGVKMPFGQDD